MRGPKYWMHEESGILRSVVLDYLDGKALTDEQITLMRLYLKQWIELGPWRGSNVDLLRATVNSLTTRHDIERWLEVADRENIDPF